MPGFLSFLLPCPLIFLSSLSLPLTFPYHFSSPSHPLSFVEASLAADSITTDPSHYLTNAPEISQDMEDNEEAALAASQWNVNRRNESKAGGSQVLYSLTVPSILSLVLSLLSS